MTLSFIEFAVSAYRLVPSLDVCPPVQEDFDSLEVTLPSSSIESGDPTLSETDITKSYNEILKSEIYIDNGNIDTCQCIILSATT